MAREMKDSGFPWIGSIPKQWKVLPAQRGFTEVKRKNVDGAVQKALQFKFGQIIPKSNFDADSDDYVAGTITSYTIVEPGTIMINGLNLNYDFKTQRTGLVKEPGIITSAYLALWPDRSMITSEYATYLFKGYETRLALHNMGAGIRLTLGYKEFKKQPVLFPSIEEQVQITGFLDTECARIDAVIEQTRASIEEYKKFKAGKIDSTILKHENEQNCYLKLSYIGQLKNGLNYKENSTEHSVKFLGVGNFKDYMILDSADMFSDIPIGEIPEEYLLQDGDIIFVRSNGSKELVGRSVMVNNIDFPLTYSGFCIRFRNKNPDLVNNRYLLFFFRSERFKELLKVGSGGTNINNLSQDVLNSIRIPVPSMMRQEEVVTTLSNISEQIDSLLANKNALISELENYKRSLIFEYVTGKKEVPA